jgi:hypothetical protein
MERIKLPDNYASLNDADLLDWKLKIEREIDHIRDRLAKAKRDAKITGIYANPGWFRSAENCRRILGRQSQQIQNEFSRRKRAKARAERRNRAAYQIFIEVARRRLTDEQYATIWAEVQAIQVNERMPGSDCVAVTPSTR